MKLQDTNRLNKWDQFITNIFTLYSISNGIFPLYSKNEIIK
jgi:hypothetical protein